CNGNYFIITRIDTNNFFLEENRKNNIFVSPFTLTLQTNCIPLVSENGPSQLLNVYPNPVKDKLQISALKLEDGSIVEMYNLFGEKVLHMGGLKGDRTSNSLPANYSVDVSSLAKGVYIVQVSIRDKIYR